MNVDSTSHYVNMMNHKICSLGLALIYKRGETQQKMSLFRFCKLPFSWSLTWIGI